MFEKLRYSAEVELTPEEERIAISNAITKAKIEKAARIRSEIYWKSVKSEKVYPTFTADQMYDLVQELGIARSVEKGWPNTFQIDDHNRSIIKALCLYFTGDERFVNAGDGFSLNKGILLAGDVGCGKTVIMSLFRFNQVCCYAQNDCLEISREFRQQTSGQDVIARYVGNVKSSDKSITLGQEHLGRFFDDLGAEGNARNFGNEINVMAEIILGRYSQVPHYMTHFTTNLTLEGLRECYGDRVYDRLREMCNVMMFPASAKSRRG